MSGHRVVRTAHLLDQHTDSSMDDLMPVQQLSFCLHQVPDISPTSQQLKLQKPFTHWTKYEGSISHQQPV